MRLFRVLLLSTLVHRLRKNDSVSKRVILERNPKFLRLWSPRSGNSRNSLGWTVATLGLCVGRLEILSCGVFRVGPEMSAFLYQSEPQITSRNDQLFQCRLFPSSAA